MSEDTKPTDELKAEVSEAVDTVKSAAADATADAKDDVKEVADTAKDVVADAKDDVKEAVADVKDDVKSAVADAKQAAADAEESIGAAENATEVVEVKPQSKSSKKHARKHAAPEPEPTPAPEKSQGLGMGAWIAIAIAALVVGLLIGKFALGGGSAASASGALSGKLAVAEADLETPMATFTYKGKTGTVTVREVIEQNGTLESAIDADGNYTLPAADSALALARNKILEMEAENLGLSVTDEEVAAYSEETLGTSDYASIASTYGMEEQNVIDIMKSSAIMSKLRDSVVETSDATMPDAPAEPATTTETVVNEETGEEETNEVTDTTTPTKEYADYIIALAGDEWDSTTGTWAAADGMFATALSTYEITADGASYEAAQTAYYVAYQIYSEAQSTVQAQWTNYVNGLLSEATIAMNTLVS